MLSEKAQHYKRTYEALSLDELLGVQRVHIKDYERFKLEGPVELMEPTLAVVNALGEVIDERDGTTRIR